MFFDKKIYKDFDKSLFAAVITIAAIGLLVIYSAALEQGISFEESFFAKQFQWMAIGAVLIFFILNISYDRFIDISYILYAVNIICLVLVLVLGRARLGAERWLSMGSFAFQPSEFMKLSLILALASYIGANREEMRDIRHLIVPIFLLAMPFVLVLLQPDLGTALLLLPIFFSMLIAGLARLKHLFFMALAGIISLPFFWQALRDYQKQRLMVFINPNADPLGAGYTIIQSKIAIGSGGLFGKGWLSGTQNQLNFLPERHTDFIFSVIGEELGFLGAAALVLLYLFVVKRTLDIAERTGNIYGRLIATGAAVMIGLQVIINIGMTIGLMPVVGIPLPLVSYGGSSLIMNLIAVALVLNIGMRR